MDIIPVFLGLLFLVIGVAGTILWIWMIVDCATKERAEGRLPASLPTLRRIRPSNPC